MDLFGRQPYEFYPCLKVLHVPQNVKGHFLNGVRFFAVVPRPSRPPSFHNLLTFKKLSHLFHAAVMTPTPCLSPSTTPSGVTEAMAGSLLLHASLREDSTAKRTLLPMGRG